MLSDHMAWRKEWDPDAVRQEHIDTALRSGNWRMMPETKNKVPCIFIDLAKWNPHQYTCAEYVRMVSYFQSTCYQIVISLAYAYHQSMCSGLHSLFFMID